MRAKTGFTIASVSALSLLLCAAAGLRAQTTPAAPADAAAGSTQDSANDLSVAVGKTVLVDTTWPIKRVAIGVSEIAEVHGTSPTEIMVNGKTAGETSLIVWDTHGGRQFFNVTVRASNAALNDSLDSIRRELRNELPGQPLKISMENGSILLRGTVKDLDASRRAVSIAATAGKVVNLLNVDVPESDPQFLLKVRFISVDRTKEAQLGINIFSTGFGNTFGGISTGSLTSTLSASGTTVGGGTDNPGTIFRLTPTSHGWKETILYNFTAGNDGAYPSAAPILDSAGHLFGTTLWGGPAGDTVGGVAFELKLP